MPFQRRVQTPRRTGNESRLVAPGCTTTTLRVARAVNTSRRRPLGGGGQAQSEPQRSGRVPDPDVAGVSEPPVVVAAADQRPQPRGASGLPELEEPRRRNAPRPAQVGHHCVLVDQQRAGEPLAFEEQRPVITDAQLGAAKTSGERACSNRARRLIDRFQNICSSVSSRRDPRRVHDRDVVEPAHGRPNARPRGSGSRGRAGRVLVERPCAFHDQREE